jgi:X-Pro dipeptidyl-peptidase
MPHLGGLNESLAGKAVVDWLNGRATAYTSTDRSTEVSADWTTGKVGMIGTSYNGTLPIGVASTGVEGLEAIVPVSAISDWYNYYRANGAVRAPGGYQGEDLDVLADYVYTRFDQEICQPVIDELRANQDRATGDRSAFWEQRDYLANADKITAATLVAHGLNDWNVMTKNASDLYEVLKANGVPHQIYLHQGGHGGNPSDTLLNRWFTRYLYDVQNGVEQLPKAYVVREDRTLTEYAEWPDPAADDVKLKFRPAAQADGVGGLAVSRDPNKAFEDLVDDASIRASALAAAESSPNRLL